MKKIKLEELSNIVFLKENDSPIAGFTTKKLIDDFGSEYELIDAEEEYFYIERMLDHSIYISKTCLFNTLLSKQIAMIESNEIYEHGYPESRLLPSDFYESCQTGLISLTQEEFSNKIEDVLHEHMSQVDFHY